MAEGAVFVHGNPGSSNHWNGFVAPVLEAIDSVRVLAPTLPGFAGAPVANDFAYTVDAYAAWLGDEIDAAGIERAHLILHDFGGPFGLKWASRYPDRVASITLIDTGIMSGYRWHRLARIWRTPVIGELFNAITNRVGFGQEINRGQFDDLPAEFVDQLYEESSGETRQTVLKLYRNTDVSALGQLADAFRELNPPTLVIWGENDIYLPSEHALKQLETFPSAKVVVLPGFGHWPYAEDHEVVLTLITQFLRKVHQQ